MDLAIIYPCSYKRGLPLGRHNLTIMNGGGPSKSLLLLDRIIYTQVNVSISLVLLMTYLKFLLGRTWMIFKALPSLWCFYATGTNRQR